MGKTVYSSIVCNDRKGATVQQVGTRSWCGQQWDASISEKEYKPRVSLKNTAWGKALGRNDTM